MASSSFASNSLGGILTVSSIIFPLSCEINPWAVGTQNFSCVLLILIFLPDKSTIYTIEHNELANHLASVMPIA